MPGFPRHDVPLCTRMTTDSQLLCNALCEETGIYAFQYFGTLSRVSLDDHVLSSNEHCQGIHKAFMLVEFADRGFARLFNRFADNAERSNKHLYYHSANRDTNSGMIIPQMRYDRFQNILLCGAVENVNRETHSSNTNTHDLLLCFSTHSCAFSSPHSVQRTSTSPSRHKCSVNLWRRRSWVMLRIGEQLTVL